MPVATSTPSASPRPSILSKMEDRKRPAISSADDLAPPSKRLAVNGNKSKEDAGDLKEEAWIEAYQKGAIYRRMQEVKREKADLESRLEQVQKRSEYHDDHLRVVDAWWNQVLEEIEVLVDSTAPAQSAIPDPPYLTGVHFKDNDDFQRHLDDKSKSIQSRVEILFNRLSSCRGQITPNIVELEKRVNGLLAAQKDYLVKLDRLNAEKDQLSEQLNTASLRYFKAEKRLDRAKSAQVQKLEQQFIASAKPAAAPGENGTDAGEVNGNAAEALLKFEEASAVVGKQKEQLETALSDIKSLQDENSALKARRESLTDEDFIRTDVFKQFKSQNEDLIKRINHLEATNKGLRDEAERLQAERTAFRTKLNDEAQMITSDLERQIEERDGDLTRIRSARDDFFAKSTMLQANQDQEKSAMQQIKELAATKEDRIVALELELGRLKPAEDEEMTDPNPELDGLSAEELLTTCKKLQQDFKSIDKEMPALRQAYRRTIGLSQKKVMDFTALEERVAMLIAEKQKADQKYFAVRKDADYRERELQSLRSQNRKSSEIVAQLKEAETQHRLLISNLEKQLSDLKQANASIAAEHKRMETASSDASRRQDSFKTQISELSNLVKARDAAAAVVRERNTTQEAEVERLRVRVDHIQKERDNWKVKALSNSSEEEENLRKFALCTVCRNNFKDTALKTCGHLFCSQCVDDRISNRMRKCPNCSRAFDRLDVMSVHH